MEEMEILQTSTAIMWIKHSLFLRIFEVNYQTAYVMKVCPLPQMRSPPLVWISMWLEIQEGSRDYDVYE